MPLLTLAVKLKAAYNSLRLVSLSGRQRNRRHVCMGMKAAAQWTSASLTNIAALFSQHMHARLTEKTLADPGLVWCQYHARKFEAMLFKLPDAQVPELFLLTK